MACVGISNNYQNMKMVFDYLIKKNINLSIDMLNLIIIKK